METQSTNYKDATNLRQVSTCIDETLKRLINHLPELQENVTGGRYGTAAYLTAKQFAFIAADLWAAIAKAQGMES